MASFDEDDEFDAASSDDEFERTFDDVDNEVAGDFDEVGDNDEDNENVDYGEDEDTQENEDSSNTVIRSKEIGREPDRGAMTNGVGGSAGIAGHFKPTLRAGVVEAAIYDIVPTIAAPHSTSINAITATPDMKLVFSGGLDGWVRKFNWPDTVNGKSLLTVAQRHPFVDSVTKAGILTGYWENEDTLDASTSMQYADDGPSLSPVYSLAVQSQALWLLSGTESGAINLQAVRHEEGKRITSLYKHTSAVSVMSLLESEASLLSGGWDKFVYEWDLNTGQTKRAYRGSSGQISALELRPISSLPVPRFVDNEMTLNGTFSANDDVRRESRASLPALPRRRSSKLDSASALDSPHNSLFEENDDVNSLFGDGDNGGGSALGFGQDDDDELGRILADSNKQNETRTDDGDMLVENATDLIPHNNPVAEENNVAHLDQDDNMDLTNDFTSSEDARMLVDTPNDTETNAVAGPTDVFLDAAIDGTLRIWDRRQANVVAQMPVPRSSPPWCMHACWSYDGNYIYAGRRNGTVDEYSLHKSLREPCRTLKFPPGSGAVTAIRSLPNQRHLICASYDILRLYDLKDEGPSKHAKVPFLIVPGHRTGVISQLYVDSTCTFMISASGNRGWDGTTTEVLLGYEIGIGV